MATDRNNTVIVGIDGSDESVKALQWAEEYATMSDATLHLVTTWDIVISYGLTTPLPDFHPDQDAAAVLDKAVATLSLPSDKIQTTVCQGRPGPMLVEASADAKALVIGSKGHGAVTGMLIGSVSAYCVQRASCPVIVIR